MSPGPFPTPFLLSPRLPFPLTSPSGFPSSTACCPCPRLTLFPPDLASQGSPNSHPSEELLKQPDYSDKIKQMLGNAPRQPWGPGQQACSGVGGDREISRLTNGFPSNTSCTSLAACTAPATCTISSPITSEKQKT